MKRSRYSPEQVAFALRQAESGSLVPDVCRKMGIGEQTFYRWKKVYAGMGVEEVRRLRIHEEENRKLKQLVANLSLENRCSRTCSEKTAEACSYASPCRVPADVLPGQRAPRLRCPARLPVELQVCGRGG